MRACVYTYLLGAYDQLLPQPAAADSDVDFICFTDDPGLRSDTWQVRLIESRYPSDLVRSARFLKIVGDPSLDEYDVTLCIDASVLLRARPEAIIDAWLDDEHPVALATHSYREQLIDEFDEVVRLNYDDRARVHEQLLSYALHHGDELTAKPLWTGMMVRRRTPEVAAAMQLWFDHVLRFSRRDQLSVNVALAQSGLAYRALALDNFESEYHQWPVIAGRKIAQGKASPYPAGPLIAELRRANRRADDLERALHDAGVADIDDMRQTFARLRGEIAQGHADRAQIEQRAHDAGRDAVRWEERWGSTQGVTGASANLARAVRSALLRPWRRS